MILSAQTIRKLGIFTPFTERGTQNGMSYGLSVAGYDVRIDVDALRPGWDSCTMDGCIHQAALKPGEFLLVSTLEHFAMPDDVMGIVHDKSTWARKGLAVQNTVIEPGWCGHLTLELTNHGPSPILFEHGDPVAQIILHRVDQPVEKIYSGKYQFQPRGPQPSKYE